MKTRTSHRFRDADIHHRAGVSSPDLLVICLHPQNGFAIRRQTRHSIAVLFPPLPNRLASGCFSMQRQHQAARTAMIAMFT